ncbi:baseplate wedge protein 53 [bacterium]|nr:baseplate wedge protein 53 [bacterium]
MATKYFKNFPLVQYGEHSVRNIILKAKLAKNLLDRYDNYYPYTIKEGERITEVAYDYYGSIDYVWLIMIANGMIDPYYDWPLMQSEFDQYVIKKYGSIETAMNINNANYYTNPNLSYYMTKTTYDNISASERTGWVPIDNYSYEIVQNEQKRKIRLLDRNLAIDISIELEKLFKKVNV